jgi:hypothetical protein
MKTSSRYVVLFFLSTAVTWSFCGCGCGCSDNGAGKKDSGVDADAAQEHDGRVDGAIDGAVDAEMDGAVDGAPVDAFVYHDCMAPLEVTEITTDEHYRIPVNEQEFHGGFAWNGQYLVQSDRRCDGETFGRDIYAIDMHTLQEEIVVVKKASQVSPSIAGHSFVYTDFSLDTQEDHRAELFLYDLSTHQETRLTDSNEIKVWPKFNGTHVVYQNNHYLSENDKYSTLRLLDIATGHEIVLATEEQGITSSNIWDINAEYVAWRAVPDGEPSSAWDVFLHHIASGQTSRLDTPSDMILSVRLSDNWVVWSEDRTGNWALYASDLDTLVEQEVAADTFDKVLSSIHGNLVVWFDHQRSGCDFPCSSYDIVIADILTGEQRRLTEQVGLWGASKPLCPWFLYTESGPAETVRVYLWDMVAAGVVDQNCNVIPCDPQTEQCAMLEWRGPP